MGRVHKWGCHKWRVPTLDQRIVDAASCLRRLHASLAKGSRPRCIDPPRFIAVVSAALAVCDKEVAGLLAGAAAHPDRRKRRLVEVDLRRQWTLAERRCYKLKRKLHTHLKSRREDASSKMGGRLQNMWFIRAGLSPPGVPLRKVTEFLNDFPRVETKSISHSYVGEVRDAFCEIILEKRRADLCQQLAAAKAALADGEQLVVAIHHAHDEARDFKCVLWKVQDCFLSFTEVSF